MFCYLYLLLLFGLNLSPHSSEAAFGDTFKRCCDLGTNWADEKLACANFPTPVAGIADGEQTVCLTSVKLCCTKAHRETQCKSGQDAAKAEKECTSVTGKPGAENFKDCCEACKMGIIIGSSGEPCDPSTFGPPLDASFLACCREKQPSTTTEATTSTSTTQTTTIATSTAAEVSTTSTTPTTLALPQTTTPASRNKNKLAPPPPPPLESLCDTLADEICAHICVPVPGSYRCECRKGFTLMGDGKSCQQRDVSDRCKINNPCDQQCFDTGVAVRCSCDRGYKLNPDKVTCSDIDECAEKTDKCDENQDCINELGTYNCLDPNDDSAENEPDDFDEDRCPFGYKYDSFTNVCDDLDECRLFLDNCGKGKKCENTIGSFKCVDEGDSKDKEKVDCPPGYRFKASIESCADIDECATGEDDCNRDSQICLNTQGGFTCQNRASRTTCPAGFKINVIGVCEDINECRENIEICSNQETCVNEMGGYRCNPGKEPEKTTTTTEKEPEDYDSIESPPESKPNASLPPVKPTLSFEKPPSQVPIYIPQPEPTNYQPHPNSYQPPESKTSKPEPLPPTVHQPGPAQPRGNQTPTQQLPNQPHYPRPSYPNPQQPNYQFAFFQPSGQNQPNSQPAYPIPSYIPYSPPVTVSCQPGFVFSPTYKRCIDNDECVEDQNACDSTQECRNTVGSFKCICKSGFQLDSITGACTDINECQTDAHDCVHSQRCDNTIGSYQCVRYTSCGTGYTLNAATGLCEDDDECTLGTHQCGILGPHFQCRNTLGSFRCERKRCLTSNCYSHRTEYVEPDFIPKIPLPVAIPKNPLTTVQSKKCLPGYLLNSYGDCGDVNECDTEPCQNNQKCVNTNGSYRCLNLFDCRPGFKVSDDSTSCEDIDECQTGTHSCSAQQKCINRIGSHICQCPPGHILTKNFQCEDINECDYYKGQQICGRTAECENTPGSYRCKCKEGFRETPGRKSCDDVDECKEMPGLCHQTCVNIWGSYRCACHPGYTLNTDNRTCTDIDECEVFKDKHLCAGICQNTPGSYSCRCPEGYRLGSDGRTCQDIDECARGNICPNADDVCSNIHGSYRCNSIKCPHNYVKDPDHRNRCKRASEFCNSRDLECMRQPSTYSYNFITFVSRLPLPSDNQLDLFTMRGPSWDRTTVTFSMELVNVRCPLSLAKADKTYFRMRRINQNTAVISLVKIIDGPQEAELQLTMEIYRNGEYKGSAVAKLFVIVSQYEF